MIVLFLLSQNKCAAVCDGKIHVNVNFNYRKADVYHLQQTAPLGGLYEDVWI